MKRLMAVIAVAAAALPAYAGLTYNFQSVSTGMRDTTVAGTATADQGRMRLDIARGDGAVLRDNTVALSINGGRALRVIDPAAKTFYDVDLDQLMGGVSALVQQLGGLVTIKVQNVRVVARDAGDGGAIEGYPTRRALVDSDYDLVLDAFGQKSTIHVVTKVQSWVTQALPTDMTSVFQLTDARSGIDDIDKLIASQSGAVKGFPLKQITTFRANDMSSTTTTTISRIQKGNVDSARFATPAGYTRAQSPFDTLAKTLAGK